MSILLVLAAAGFGSLAGFLAADRFGRGRRIAALVVLAAIAAAATNATQGLLDLGLPFTTVDVLEAASYFVFGFSVTAAWLLLKPSRLRWFLAALVPVALFEPLRWAFALITWSLR
jgi:hypothetical protein